MPNYITDSIRIFKDDNSNTVENAFNDIFYGPSAAGQTEADGYPDDTLSNLPFDVADYEITIPEDLGETVTIDNGTTTIISSTSGSPAIGPFTSASVGKYLWDATNVSALKLIGKIAIYDGTNEVYLDGPYLGTSLEDAPCYISSSANNNSNFSNKGDFIILIKTAPGEENINARIFPNYNPNFGFSLKIVATPNSEYNVNNELNTSYINLMRISDKGVKGKPTTAAAVPATITRINGYISSGTNNFFRDSDDFPIWVAFKINPFGTSGTNFSKNTVYSLEINEELPYYSEISYNIPKSSASAGFF